VYTLFAIRLATRQVEILGTTTSPDSAFMAQIVRNITSQPSPVFDGVTHLLIDRYTKFTEHFRRVLDESGIEIVRTPPDARKQTASPRGSAAPHAGKC